MFQYFFFFIGLKLPLTSIQWKRKNGTLMFHEEISIPIEKSISLTGPYKKLLT
jgi:hypothetical protein